MLNDKDLTELARENQRLSSLVGLAGLLADPALALEEKLERCLKELAWLAGAESASLMLVEGGSLVVRAASNPRLLGLATPLEQETIATHVARTGQAIHLPDIQESPWREHGRQGGLSSYRSRSAISLPLLVDGAPVGVLNLTDKLGAPAFDLGDLALAQDLARQISRQVHFCALHQELAQAHARLEAAQRAREDLMHLVFHDMKAPLGVVREALGRLRPNPTTPAAEREQYLALAESELELLWRRVTNLLDLRRMDAEQYPLDRQPLDLASLLAEVLARLEPLAALKGVELTGRVEAAPRPLADEDLTERILVNLIGNALTQAAPEQGGGGWVRVGLHREMDLARLEVRDSGPGVDPALGPGLFERFASGGSSPGSSGLGLYFCRRAARLMGGEVFYRNREGGGADFSLVLPLERRD